MFLFEWDDDKAKANVRKHQVTFEEASSVFFDENARFLHDPQHSTDESRFILLGFSETHKMLVVCHCFRQNEQTVRIISARKASKKETHQYWSFMNMRIGLSQEVKIL